MVAVIEGGAAVYLLHFDRRYPRGRRPQHYIGVSDDPERRFREHRNGNVGKGGSLMRALAAEKIGFQVARLEWYPTAAEAFRRERELKRARHHERRCTVCRPCR